MVLEMATEFSEDGKYFAQIASDGKIKIWDTEASVLEQEYVPDFHLTSPCTCLHFLNAEIPNKGISPKKKKRRESISETITAPKLALGTSTGLLLLYSISKADIESTINSDTSLSLSCISSKNNTVCTGAEQTLLVWDISKKTVQKKWKVGSDKISAVLVLPGDKILTASKSIKLWDLNTKELLHTFIGHSSDVTCLKYINPIQNTDRYFVSAGKDDRILSCWNLNNNSDKNAVAHFLMEDVIQNIIVNTNEDGSTSLAATVRSGVVHIYQHTLNGKCGKPLKPKTTIQVVSDTGQSKDVVLPIRIISVYYRDNVTLSIAYGSELLLTFENITISTYKKVQCLVRKDPIRNQTAKDVDANKVRTPIVSKEVTYLSQATHSVIPKRKNDGQQEVPMEQRLENLMLNKDDSTGPKKLNNVAHLLVQALHSKDKNMLKIALFKKDEVMIRNTVKRLPVNVLVPMIEELNTYIKGKTLSCQIGSLWLKHILQVHASMILSNSALGLLLTETLQTIENRLALQMQLNKLRGRLDLLVSQIDVHSTEESNENEEPLLVFNDKDSSDSDSEEMELDLRSESEQEWEESENEDATDQEEENGIDENDMSSSDE